jgi:hypothetical protein
MANKRSLYYDPTKPSAFSTLNKLASAVADKDTKNKGKRKKKHARDDIEAWLLKKDVYTIHRPVRKRFPRNPYSVDNIMEVWECDLVYVQSLAKYSDGYRYMLTVIDVFSKFLHIVPLSVKTGTAEASAFLSILGDKIYSKPVRIHPTWVRTAGAKSCSTHRSRTC